MESRKILVVEDEFITASDLKAILEKDGYTVAGIARTGEEAIKLAGQDPPDLILMDIKLGSSMDGIETARILRESTGVPVVYLTAHSEREFLERAKLTEPNGYLIKPYNPGQVSATLEMALHKADMEKRLAESEARYRFLAENMSDMVWIIGPDLRTTYVSPSIEKVLGFTPEERNQQSIEEAVTPESLREIQKRFVEELQRDKEIGADLDRSVVIDVEYYRKDGSTVWMENRVQAIRDSENRVTGMFGVSRDITERKQAEAERAALEAQNRQLQKAESLGRMAGAIAHHFNNQLQAVMGNLEMAIGDLPQASGPVEALAEAMMAAHRAARVSGQMLTYLGLTSAERKPLHLSEACRLSLPMLEAAMPKNMALETDLSTPGPAIRANPNQMQQVLTHLVTNAWESMAEAGGVIHLSVTTARAEDIPESHRFPINWQPKEKAYACLEVRDSGLGIPEPEMEKLFDPFFSTKFTGRGLGLPVVLGIVKAHGGAITVESGYRAGSGEQGAGKGTLGGLVYPVAPEDDTGASLRENALGSVFRVFLPLCEEALPRPAEKAAKAPALKGGGTVLVIDDEPQVLKLAARMITLLGFEVLTAKNGVEGVEVFREHQDQIRFVLSDLTMPRMDGWQTLAALRKVKPDVSVILASGYDEASVMSDEHAEWPQAFLGKPYSLEDLRKTIGRVLQ